jgi:glutamine amidotransferase
VTRSATTRLAIIDSGGANIASLQYAIERLGVPSELTTDPQRLRDATHIILPGVGAAADCMQRLQNTGLTDSIGEFKQPMLGICVGMQLMFESSEEGDVRCLGLFPGRVRKLKSAEGFPVPHMGWNQIVPRSATPLLSGIESSDYVYYVHSYAAPVSGLTLAGTQYSEAFSAVVQRGNFYGVQFHPERSARVGARLLQNFLRLS